MNILFITPSYKPAVVYGGPTVSVSELAESLVKNGASVTVYTTTANGKAELDVSTTKPVLVNGVSVHYFKRLSGDHTHVSPALWRKLYTTITDFDILHIQSWWSLLVFGAAGICCWKKRGFIVSPRGMLSQYTFATQHTGVKKVLHKMIGKRFLRQSWLHATTILEWKDCLHVNPKWSGFVLPNLVRFPPHATVKSPSGDKKPLVLGFLSRIDPKKGLENLFKALAKVDFPFQLRIAGEGEEHYISGLKLLAERLNLSAHIDWCGWQDGAQKFDFLRSVDVFTLTSHNENFANVVIESLSVGTAVMVSEGVGLCDYVSSRNLGWVSKPEPVALLKTLKQVNIEREKIVTIAKRAPAEVCGDFNHNKLAVAYLQEYGELHKVRFNKLGRKQTKNYRNTVTQP